METETQSDNYGNDYEDEITDCIFCGTLLPEDLVCQQCGTSHKEVANFIKE